MSESIGSILIVKMLVNVFVIEKFDYTYFNK